MSLLEEVLSNEEVDLRKTTLLSDILVLPYRKGEPRFPWKQVPGVICGVCLDDEIIRVESTVNGLAHDHESEHAVDPVDVTLVREAFRRIQFYQSDI